VTGLRTARLFGGHYDGRVLDVTTEILIRGLHVAIPPTFADCADLFGPNSDRPAPVTAPVERYCFDGTVNEQGEYRFRVES
jgi:hypothetical protein